MSSCEKKGRLEDRKEEFYLRFLFIEGGAYTLFGSKPMTEIVLDNRSKETKEEEQRVYQTQLTEQEKKAYEHQNSLEWNPKYDFEEMWKEWEQSLDKNRLNKFLIVHFPRHIDNFDFVYLVNILETATIIKQHYCLFKKFVGFEFDPLSVTFDIQNKQSTFWNKIFNSPASEELICLMGLLFGYGLENSYPFSLLFSTGRQGHEGQFISKLYIEILNQKNLFDCHCISSQSFPLPGFKMFSEPNPTLEKYRVEREKIKKSYLGKDLEKTTLEKLYLAPECY